VPADKKRDYAVGYGKPPRHTQFTKGQSGNPRGRAPGTKNLKTLLIDTVVVAENGRRRTIKKRHAFIKQIVNQAVKGDWRPAKLLLDTLQRIEDRAEPETAQASFDAADAKVIEQLKTRLGGRRSGSDD